MVTTFSFFLKVYSLLLNINIYAKILHFVKLSLVLMAMELNKENILETCLYLLDTCKLDISPQIAVENLEKLTVSITILKNSENFESKNYSIKSIELKTHF